MSNTTFSIELQGLLLPDDVKNKLQAALRSVVLAEVAKTDLGKEVSITSLPGGSERMTSPVGPILGFVIKNVGRLTERSTAPPSPGLLYALPDGVKAAQAVFGPAPSSTMAVEGALPIDALEDLYCRPDIRAAVASNTRALAELLSRDEQAMRVLNQLAGETDGSSGGTERIAPLALALAIAGGLIVGGLIADASRRQIPK